MPDPKRMQSIKEAYRPLRDDSTFEFTIESIRTHDGGAMTFGLVTKGTVHEGCRLRLIRQSGAEIECICRAIAGLSNRLVRASVQEGEKNIGLWLDVPPAQLKPYDRLISFDSPASARQVAPANWEFSILHGVKSGWGFSAKRMAYILVGISALLLPFHARADHRGDFYLSCAAFALMVAALVLGLFTPRGTSRRFMPYILGFVVFIVHGLLQKL